MAKVLDYSLKRWIALTRYLDDGAVPIENNWVENQIRQLLRPCLRYMTEHSISELWSYSQTLLR